MLKVLNIRIGFKGVLVIEPCLIVKIKRHTPYISNFYEDEYLWFPAYLGDDIR